MENQLLLLSEQEFADAVGISRITAWRLRAAGKLSHYRIGNRVRYSKEHIREFLESSERRARTNSRKKKPSDV